MDIKMSGDASARELMRRLRAAAGKAPATMKTSMRQAVVPFRDEVKDRASAFRRTGATVRSIGTSSLREGVRIGVRPGWVDGKTGKKPSAYAAKVNAAQGDWFGAAWKAHKETVPRRIMVKLNEQLLKKGF
jgi:hypothetical protein